MFNHKQRGCLIPDKGIRSLGTDKFTCPFNLLHTKQLI